MADDCSCCLQSSDLGTPFIEDRPTQWGGHLHLPGTTGRGLDKGTLRDRMRKFEIQVIQEAIEDAGGDRRAAARTLEIGLSSLYRKLELAAPPPIFCD
ncbi:MAG: hypothetical protein HQM02_03350 [Magnetococcales bacterium]|nr:hypothetical protein [Magnetococcales bacterium]